MEIADKIHVNSFLIGILVALTLISVYLSFQSNVQHEASDSELKEIKQQMAKISSFIDQNEFVKQ